MKNIEASRTQHSFHFLPTSDHLVPIHTLRQRFLDIWHSLTWTVVLRIIKANIAVTIALGLLFVEPIREKVGLGGVLACVAVEFVHPAKSYGFISEDIVFGAFMCTVSAGWSLLGTYCASLARNPTSAVQAQPKVCAILAIFLVVGAFVLNYVRVKFEQANVGGMLSATIMVISLTTAVLDHQWNPYAVLQDLVPVLVGFMLVLLVCIIILPENSTRIYVQQLIKTLETFDGILQRQVDGFVQIRSQEATTHHPLSNFGSKEAPESLVTIHTTIDTMLSALIEKKRIVRREASYNCIAPGDVSEMTKLVKNLRIPLQGIGLSRAMESNMRKAELRNRLAAKMKHFATHDHLDPMTTDDQDDGIQVTDDSDITHGSDEALSIPETNSAPPPTTAELQNELDEKYAAAEQKLASGQSSNERDQTTIRLDSAAFQPSAWRQDYDELLKTVRPNYLDLRKACSTAIDECIHRLRRIQSLDPRLEGRPFFFRYFIKANKGGAPAPADYARHVDPSEALLSAIHRFDRCRLKGLDRLFSEDHTPHRALFMMLLFQCDLRGYAESVYTLTSLIYEMDHGRTKRKFWLPHLPLRKILRQKVNLADSYDLDTPGAITESNALTLQRTLSEHNARLQSVDFDSCHALSTPQRGRLLSHPEVLSPNPQPTVDMSHVALHRPNSAYQETLEYLNYHDPDVAFPTTPSQRFFYTCWRFCVNNLYTADTAFAFRACIVVAALSLPAFLEESVHWYNGARGQWAVIVALIWMGPSIGSNFFGTMVRTVGTFIGAVMALIIWEIGQRTIYGILIATFIFNLPWWLIYLNGKFWKATGMFSLITISLIIGYSYNYMKDHSNVSVYEVTYQRTLSVLAGVLGALLLSIFPYPRTGRVELRHRAARTLNEIATLYSSFLALLLKNSQSDNKVRLTNQKLFRAIASSIRQQIKGERVLLEQSRFEPALRGVFREDQYVQMLQIFDNMLNLMLEMEYSLSKVDIKWRSELVDYTWKERRDMIASFLTSLHLAANALINKTALPPFILRPTKARRILTNKARKLPHLKPEHLTAPEYTYYSAYLMNSEQLAVEIELLVATVQELVGPDSVNRWLQYRPSHIPA